MTEWVTWSGDPHPVGDYDRITTYRRVGEVLYPEPFTGKKTEVVIFARGRDRKPNRLDGPAMIDFFDGIPLIENFYLDGLRHRLDGPSVVYIGKDGEVDTDESEFHLYGLPLSEAEHAEAVAALGEGAPFEWVRSFVLGGIS